LPFSHLQAVAINTVLTLLPPRDKMIQAALDYVKEGLKVYTIQYRCLHKTGLTYLRTLPLAVENRRATAKRRRRRINFDILKFCDVTAVAVTSATSDFIARQCDPIALSV